MKFTLPTSLLILLASPTAFATPVNTAPKPQCGIQTEANTYGEGTCGVFDDLCWCNDPVIRKFYADGINSACTVVAEREIWQQFFNFMCGRAGGEAFKPIVWKGGSTPIL
ncbi:hypothetical protein Vi05172_g9523 [Venturia inaequalis]|nr:hypothetical protein Vi05172_g9523 [Venturia inaequalis]